MTDCVLVLTTIPLTEQAAGIPKTLVEERLAACVSAFPPMRSTYRWQGDVTEDGEQQLLIKTTRGQLAELERRLRALHPYEIPEFLVVTVEAGSEAYLAWVRANGGRA